MPTPGLDLINIAVWHNASTEKPLTIHEDIVMNQPTLNGAFVSVYSLLSKLLDSAALDLDSEAKDCLVVFDQYDWKMIDGKDAARFNQLKAMGDEGEMSLSELREFMSMVSEHGETHIYHTITQGQDAISRFHLMNQEALGIESARTE